MEAMDDLLVAPFLEALPPGEIWLDATNDPLHGNQKDVSSTGTTICRCTSSAATMWRVRGCGPRTSTGRRGRNWRASSNAGIGRRSSFAEMAGRDGARCDDNNADCLFGLARNARLTERVGRQLRKLRRRRVSTGKASRRFFRYRTRGSWSRARRAVAKAERRPRGVRFVAASLSREWAGAQVFYEDLHCARGENGIKERQPVRRPDVDRGRARQRASILRLSPAPGRQGPGRNDSDEEVAVSVRGIPLSFSSTCPWKNRSPGSWRTYGRLRRHRRNAARPRKPGPRNWHVCAHCRAASSLSAATNVRFLLKDGYLFARRAGIPDR